MSNMGTSPVDTEFEALPSAVMLKGTHCGPQEDAAKRQTPGKVFPQNLDFV